MTDDYIKRSDVIKTVRYYKNFRKENRVPSIDDVHLTEYQLLVQAINNIPAADVEPVIHCKDCVHGCPEKGHEPDVHCSWWDYPMPPMGFCSKAMRKKGEE